MKLPQGRGCRGKKKTTLWAVFRKQREGKELEKKNKTQKGKERSYSFTEQIV